MSTSDHIEFQAQINKRQNPFIERIQRKPLHWKKILLWSAFVFVVALLSVEIGFFRNGRYYPKVAVFTGNAHVSDQVLVQELNTLTKGSRLFGLIPKKHMLFLPKEQIQKTLNDRFGMTNVSVDAIVHQRTIHVSLQEAPIAYHLLRNDDVLNVTRDGHILDSGIKVSQNASQPTTYEGLTIHFTDKSEALSGLTQIPKGTMDVIKLIDAAASTIQNSIILTKIQAANESSNDLQLITAKGWYIRIDSTENVTTQIQNAQKVFTEKIQNTAKEAPLQYIDARILDRVYYK